MKAFLLFFFLCYYGCLAQKIISQDYSLNHDSIVLPGTLSYPKLDKKMPLVVFVHGSGPVDRNGNQGILSNANYIKMLADTLNANGIAFYRFDKRTATPENLPRINMEKFRLSHLADDASVAIDTFKNDPRFSSLFLIGHSQGSLVGMLALDENVDGFISLAGPSTTFDETLLKQLKSQNEELGKKAALHIAELMDTDTIQKVNPFLISLFAPVNQKFLKDWMLLNPSEEIKKITVPTLIVNGDADLQVGIEDAQALLKAKPDAQLKIIPKMNHVLKTVQSQQENLESYQKKDYPISEELIAILLEFINSHG